MSLSSRLNAVFGGIGPALSHPDYRTYWIGQSVATVGRWMYRMAVGWLTWELTKSTSWLGIIAFADAAPVVVFTIFAGAIADRIGYFRVMRTSQFVSGCNCAVFAALTITGHITIELVLLLTLLGGSFEAVNYPARMAAVNTLVPRRDLSSAIALGSTTFNGARIVGPALAGGLILWIGNGGVIAIGAATFFWFWVVLVTLRAPEPKREARARFDLFGDVAQGIRYVAGDPGIRFLMILMGLTGLFIRPYIDLLPGYAAKVFESGPEGLSILLSSIGVGAMCAGITLARRGTMSGLTRFVSYTMLGMGAAQVAFLAADSIWVGAAFLVMSGFFMLGGSVSSQTLIQNAVDSAMRARVMSLFVVISWGIPSVGSLAMGWVASFAGLQHTLLVGAVVTLSAWLWTRRETRRVSPALEGAIPAVAE
jgi:MFS family permease